MPNYDLICKEGHEQLDLLLKVGERPPCPKCGSTTETLWVSSCDVIQDSIEGGVWIRHGICNSDGTPKKYYSKSEMVKAAEKKGLMNLVEHKTLPGTDKSPHTTRWV